VTHETQAGLEYVVQGINLITRLAIIWFSKVVSYDLECLLPRMFNSKPEWTASQRVNMAGQGFPNGFFLSSYTRGCAAS